MKAELTDAAVFALIESMERQQRTNIEMLVALMAAFRDELNKVLYASMVKRVETEE